MRNEMGNNNTTTLKEEENKTIESPEETQQECIFEEDPKKENQSVPADENNGDHEKSTEMLLDAASTNGHTTDSKEQGELLPSDSVANTTEGDNTERETSPAFRSEAFADGAKLSKLDVSGKMEIQSNNHIDIKDSTAKDCVAEKEVPDNPESGNSLAAKNLLGSTKIHPEKASEDDFETEEESQVLQESNSICHIKENGSVTETTNNVTMAADSTPDTNLESGKRSEAVKLDPETVVAEVQSLHKPNVPSPEDENGIVLMEETEEAMSESAVQENENKKQRSGLFDGTELQNETESGESNGLIPELNCVNSDKPALEKNDTEDGFQDVVCMEAFAELDKCSKEQDIGVVDDPEIVAAVSPVPNSHNEGGVESPFVSGYNTSEIPVTSPSVTEGTNPDSSGTESSDQFWKAISTILSGHPPDIEETAGRVSVESNTENNSSNIDINSGMQKSPSFHLDVRPESDQTPLLYQDSKAGEMTSHQEKLRRPQKAEQIKTSPGKKKGPFLGFMIENEEELHTVATTEKQDYESGSKEKIVSIKARDKRRVRSSLFGSCICCGTVMNQTLS